jgi:antitoxin component YwqK of YwqJK toxin-antitoxin module
MSRRESLAQDDGSILERTHYDNGSTQTEKITRADGTILSRRYHANGSIESEAILTRDRGPIHGFSRRWHPNGVLAQELSFDHGLWDGVQRVWNDKGELVDSFEMKKGTGVLHLWSLDTEFHSEIAMVDGHQTGRQLIYCDGGKTAIETYSINDKKVSKKRYFEACQKDPKLPRYDWEPPVPRPKVFRAKRRKEPVKVSDDLPLSLLAGSDVREALTWLTEAREPSRSLGEGTTQGNSLKLVKKLYGLGAVSVNVVEIRGAPNEDQNSGKLVVELPEDAERRKKLLQFSNRRARKLGFDPDPDGGQRYIFMMLD